MSALFQGLANDTGRVEITILGLPVLPSSATHHRGIALDNGKVLVSPDNGTYPRVHINGIAVHNPTGIVLIDGAALPATIVPGALLADARGSITTDNTNPSDVIHQGVGLLNNGAMNVIS